MNEEEMVEEYLWEEYVNTCPYCGAEIDEWELDPEDNNIRHCYCYDCSHWWIERKEEKGN